jgi:hypothetical protein
MLIKMCLYINIPVCIVNVFSRLVRKIKYKLLSHHWNGGQNHSTKTGRRLFESISQFKYLGTTVTNQNFDLGGN